jgi:hypothetical protein
MKTKTELIEKQTEEYKKTLSDIDFKMSELRGNLEKLRTQKINTEKKIESNDKIIQELSYQKFHQKMILSL